MVYTFTANPSLDKLFIVDELRIGQYNWGNVKQYDAGGKGINVSRNLHALGVENIVLGFFAGRTGDYLINSLRDQGMVVDPISIKGESRSNITLVESTSGRMTKINEYGPEVDSEAHRLVLEKISAITKAGDIWVISGSALKGLPDDFYASMIKAIKNHGGLVFLDASGKWLIHGYQAAPSLLRINDQEAGAALNTEFADRSQIYEAMRVFNQKGIPLTVISMGGMGALFADANIIYDAKAPNVKEKTAVGAGDAMMAMIVYGFIYGWEMKKIAAWGVAAGSASVMQEGTAVITYEQVRLLVEKVPVKKVKGP